MSQVSDWTAPSPCAGWEAADLLRQVVDTQRDFLAERGAALDPVVSADPGVAWQEHEHQLRALLGDTSFAGRTYAGHFGPTTIAVSLLQIYGFDLIVHRCDLGQASGRPLSFFSDEILAVEASIESFGDLLYSDGICLPPVAVAAKAPRQDRILAQLGRRP